MKYFLECDWIKKRDNPCTVIMIFVVPSGDEAFHKILNVDDVWNGTAS